MKKLFAISIVTLAAVLTLGACACKKVPEQETLTYEQILDLPKVYGSEKRFPYNSFLEQWNSTIMWNNDVAVLKCEVLSVDYYSLRNTRVGSSGYTMAEVRVIEVVDDYNTAQVKPGQILKIKQLNCIAFSEAEDELAFFSEKLGKTITSFEELDAAGDLEFKLVPVKEIAYEYHMPENEYPLKAGESYTMFINARYAEDGSVKYYRPDNIMPLNAKTSVTEFAKEHGFVYYDDILKIAEEIAAMFK